MPIFVSAKKMEKGQNWCLQYPVQVSLLLYQYHDLLTQTLDDKEHYHEEEREYSDKMNNLRSATALAIFQHVQANIWVSK